MISGLIAALAACVLPAPALAVSAWSIQPTPNPTGGGTLNGVSCTAANVCMAVGASGSSALAERWNGTAWKIEPTPHPSEGSFLWGVSCSATNACMAVSTSGAVMRWNGTAWTLQSLIEPNLYGVSCSGGTSCTAVGFTYVKFCNIFRCWLAPADLAAQWNGTTWSASRAGGVLGKLFGVSCQSSSACVAVGSTGSNTIGEAWNGSSWTTESTANAPSSDNTLAGVSCTSATVCTAVGYAVSVPNYPQAAPLAEGLNGTTWTIEPTPSPAGTSASNLLGVSCVTSAACTAVGFAVDSSGADQTLAERYSG